MNKHEEFVTKVKDILMNVKPVPMSKAKDIVAELYIQQLFSARYNWKRDKDYQMKRISKRKNKYHYKILPYSVIKEININITVEDN